MPNLSPLDQQLLNLVSTASQSATIPAVVLAGMNAHINHDLALALLQTDMEMNLQPTLQSPERVDYQNVNGILARLLPDALNDLATGVLGGLAHDTGKIGRHTVRIPQRGPDSVSG